MPAEQAAQASSYGGRQPAGEAGRPVDNPGLREDAKETRSFADEADAAARARAKLASRRMRCS